MKKRIVILLILSLLFPSVSWGAIHADTVWEIRSTATANNVNGGGYNASNASPGTDYSQQDAAEKNNTDLAINALDNTIVSSAGSPFASSDNGNILHITAGVNFTVGWYEVVSVDGSGNATLDRACGTAGSTNGTFYLGGAMSLNSTLDDEFFQAMVAGNIVWWKDGDYNLGEHIDSSVNGTSASPIWIIGYLSTISDRTDYQTGDDPTGDDRPDLTMGNYIYAPGEYCVTKNIDMTSSFSLRSLYIRTGGGIVNVRGINTNNATALDLIAHTFAFNCEGETSGGDAIQAAGGVKIAGCYLHDSTTGIDLDGNAVAIVDNIIDTCTTGINLRNYPSINIVNNDIYNNTTGLLGSTAYSSLILNNNITDCTTGASWTTRELTIYADYNNWWNNGTDTINFTKGENATALDPQYDDAANGDFDIGTNLKDLGAPFPSTDTGLSGGAENHKDIGALQREEAGGGGEHSYGFVN